MKFKNRVALVTGSARGVGRELALEFARQGASVVVNYSRSEKEAGEVVAAIEKMKSNAVKIKADVADITHVTGMVDMVLQQFGRIDFLVNNAGSFRDSRVRNMDREIWDEVISVNLSGTFNCTKAVIEPMISQGFGRIINITSIVAQMGSIGASNYAAAKAGIIGFTRSFALEVASKGITVNALALGYINTGMTERLPAKMHEELPNQIPMKRFGEPHEVAQTVTFLCSEGAGYITGQTININGGLYM